MDFMYRCPKCNYDMEEVEFSKGHAAPDGEPGLLCHECGYRIGLDDIMEEYEDGI